MNTFEHRFITETTITTETLDWVARRDCPQIIKSFIADIVVAALHINGVSNVFCKCKEGGYTLSWILNDNGEEYIETFSEKRILDALKDKFVNLEWSIDDL